MIQKYTYGTPFETDAIVTSIPASEGTPAYGTISTENGFSFTYDMDDNDVVYGLGESNRGINKRGYVYESNCSDQPNHTEDKISLYGAHNFLVISGKQTFGLFVDYPGKLKFDIGYTLSSQLKITCEDADLYLYVIEGETPYDIVKQFRKIIGRSYIPPKFAFGFGQSRWGYTTADDFRKAADGYRENNIPIDMVYMDIDYMEDYKDFTVNQENFPDFEAYVNEMKEKGIHLVPIIDAGVKVEAGYDVYEEGVEKNYFCKREDGSDFVSAVWPGWTHFPDVLNADARAWFGQKYERLISKGIDGFWNDMNEPAMFCTPEGVAELKEYIKDDASILKSGEWEVLKEGDTIDSGSNLTGFSAYPVGIWGAGKNISQKQLVCYWTLNETENSIPEQSISFTGSSAKFSVAATHVKNGTYYKAFSIRCLKE